MTDKPKTAGEFLARAWQEQEKCPVCNQRWLIMTPDYRIGGIIHEVKQTRKSRAKGPESAPWWIDQLRSYLLYARRAGWAHENWGRIVANWIMGDILRELKNDERGIQDCPIEPPMLAEMIRMIEKGEISGKIAKTVFQEMYKTGKPPKQIVQEKNLVQVTDEGAIVKIVDQVLAAHPDQVEEYRGGREKVLGFFVGQVMKASKGKANPALVNKILKQKL